MQEKEILQSRLQQLEAERIDLIKQVLFKSMQICCTIQTEIEISTYAHVASETC